MIRGALLAASVAATLRLPATATAQQQPFWPGGYQQSFPGAVCKASCAGPPPTSVIGFNKPITLYGYTQVGTFYDDANELFGGAIVPSDVGCESPLSQILCQENADLASEFLCAEGEVATSSCVDGYCGPIATSKGCVNSDEEVQGLTLCGATCAGVALQGFDGWVDEGVTEFAMGIPDGTEGTITLALEQQGAEMTDEMCTAACAIAEAACMDNPGNPVFTCLGVSYGPPAPSPVPAPGSE